MAITSGGTLREREKTSTRTLFVAATPGAVAREGTRLWTLPPRKALPWRPSLFLAATNAPELNGPE
jgi:hypothetical protein